MSTPVDGTAFSFALESGGIAIFTLRVPDSPLNLLTSQHTAELHASLDELRRQDDVRAVVIASGHDAGFCAGADLHELIRTHALQDGIDLARDVQRALDRLTGLGVPVIAAIHGPCFGVGAALALAAHGGVASSDPRTRIGFPEVQLGLVPPGATERLTRKVGLARALDLLLGGRAVGPAEAHEIGLVDEIVPAGILLQIAIEHAVRRARGLRDRGGLATALRRRVSTLRDRLSENRLRRAVVLREAQRSVRTHAFGNHAAPERLLRVVRTGLDRGHEAWLEAERRAFGESVVSPEADHLMRLFLETNALRHDPGLDDPSVRAAHVESLGIAGVGPLTVTLVTEAGRAGLAVRLRGRRAGALADTLNAVRDRLDAQSTSLEADSPERVLGRLTVTTGLDGFGGVPLLLVAPRERLDSLRGAARELEDHTDPGAVLACVTTATAVSAIAEGLDIEARVVGWVQRESIPRGTLVEIATLRQSAPLAVATVVALAKRIGHTPIVVRDTPCFFTPRIVGAWHNEALRLVTEGVPAREVDDALAEWGFARGPLASIRELGTESTLLVLRSLAAAFGERLALTGAAEQEVERGELGAPPRRAPRAARRDIVERCVMRMVNEAVLCFGEGVVRNARDANVAAVLGAEFPAFRGGPLRYVDEVGIVETTRRLDRLSRAHGRRFAAAPLLLHMTRSGGTFHGQARVFPGSERPEATR